MSVCGNPVGEKSKALISYLPERPYFGGGMRVKEIIHYFTDFYGDFDKHRAYKVQLVLVMSRNARLYLLDEPIAGVDPAAREYILGTIVSNYNPEASIIITTHLITDVEQVLDDYIFLGFGGQVLMAGNAEDTRNQSGKSLDALFKEVFRC